MAKKKRQAADEIADALSGRMKAEQAAAIAAPHIAARLGGEERKLMPWAQRCALGLKPGQLAPKELAK